MAIGSSLLAVIVNNQLLKAVSGVAANSGTALTPEQLEMIHDPNLLMDAGLQSSIPEQVLIVLQKALGTGIIQVFGITVGVALLIAIFAFLAGRERLPMSHGGKKIGFH